MKKTEKGRSGWHQATLQTSGKTDSNLSQSRIKDLIILLALWGWVPLGLADWLVRRGGQR